MYNNNSKGGLSYLIAIFLMFFNIYVLIQYKNGYDDLLTICTILNIFDFIFISVGKGIFILILMCIFNIISAENIWTGICLGFLFFYSISAIYFIITTLIILIGSLFKKK